MSTQGDTKPVGRITVPGSVTFSYLFEEKEGMMRVVQGFPQICSVVDEAGQAIGILAFTPSVYDAPRADIPRIAGLELCLMGKFGFSSRTQGFILISPDAEEWPSHYRWEQRLSSELLGVEVAQDGAVYGPFVFGKRLSAAINVQCSYHGTPLGFPSKTFESFEAIVRMEEVELPSFEEMVVKIEALIREKDLPKEPTSEVIAGILGVPVNLAVEVLWTLLITRWTLESVAEESPKDSLMAIRREHFADEYKVWAMVATVADGQLPSLPWVWRHHFGSHIDQDWGKAVLERVGDKVVILWGMDSPGGFGLWYLQLLDLVGPLEYVGGLTDSPGTHKLEIPDVGCHLNVDEEVIFLDPYG